MAGFDPSIEVWSSTLIDDMGHLIGAIASDDLVLVAAEAFEQGPTQRASSGSMPLVASNRGGETSAACPGSATGSIRLFAAALVLCHQ